MLGIWLAISPFVFTPGDAANGPACSFWVGAGIVIASSILAYWPPLHRVHLVNLLVGAWLLAVGFLGAPIPPPAAYRNSVVVGLVLLMLAIVPSHASAPPKAWRAFAPDAERSRPEDEERYPPTP